MTEPTRLEELIKLLDTKQVKRDALECARVEAGKQRDSVDAEMVTLDAELADLRTGRVLTTHRLSSTVRTYYYIDSMGDIDDKWGYSKKMITLGNFYYDRESAVAARDALIAQYKAKEITDE